MQCNKCGSLYYKNHECIQYLVGTEEQWEFYDAGHDQRPGGYWANSEHVAVEEFVEFHDWYNEYEYARGELDIVVIQDDAGTRKKFAVEVRPMYTAIELD